MALSDLPRVKYRHSGFYFETLIRTKCRHEVQQELCDASIVFELTLIELVSAMI